MGKQAWLRAGFLAFVCIDAVAAQVPLRDQVIKHTLEFELLKDIVTTAGLNTIGADDDEKQAIRGRFTSIAEQHARDVLRVHREKPADADRLLAKLYRREALECRELLDELVTPAERKKLLQVAIEKRVQSPVSRVLSDHAVVFFLGISPEQSASLAKVGERIDGPFWQSYVSAQHEKCVEIASVLTGEQRASLERAVGRQLSRGQEGKIAQPPVARNVYGALDRDGINRRLAVKLLAPTVINDLGIDPGALPRLQSRISTILGEARTQTVRSFQKMRRGEVSQSEHTKRSAELMARIDESFGEFLRDELTEEQLMSLLQSALYEMLANNPQTLVRHKDLVDYLQLTTNQQSELLLRTSEAREQFDSRLNQLKKGWLIQFAAALQVDQRVKLGEALGETFR